MKAMFPSLCSGGYHHLQTALCLKLCTSWDDVHCCKQFWKSFSRIPHSNVFTLHWMSAMSANLCPYKEFFWFWKEGKIAEAKSGEQRESSMFLMDFLSRKSHTLNALCAGALLWRIHLSGQSSGLLVLFSQMDSHNFVSTSKLHPMFNLSAPRLVLCRGPHPPFVF
jgi:hypothetical protein